MHVTRLALRNFLSYSDLNVGFSRGLNVLTGRNAAGKTNLAESIFYASLGKSERGLGDRELIRWGSFGGFSIRLAIEREASKHEIEVELDESGKKRIAVDGLPITRIGELMGASRVVYFSPREIRLVRETPQERRRFMDISICQRDKRYFYALVRYNKLLAQRNRLLKDRRDSPASDALDRVIVDKMCECQELIMQRRREFLDRLSPAADAKHRALTGGAESLTLAYETERVDFADIRAGLSALYAESSDKDRRLEHTTCGAHRDDIDIAIDGVDVRKFGSQGQQRTVALSMKLAETELFREESGEYPVLILDDVLSELDRSRRDALFSEIRKIQTFVTCTEYDGPTGRGISVYSVGGGKVVRRRKKRVEPSE